MKDKKTVDIVNPVFALNKIGRPTAKGTCPICKGKVFVILGKANTPADLAAQAEKWKATHAKKGGKTGGSKGSRGSKGKKHKRSRSRSKH
jgi:hypothetical protein